MLRAEWVEEPGDVLAFVIEADAFMRHMVRVLVGTMLRRGRAGGLRGGCWRAGRAARRRATAPPHGLYLESVRY